MVSRAHVMTVDLLRHVGPLSDEQVAWINEIYGPVDAKYHSPAYVRHQFVDNPFRRSVNVFAVADGRVVGHCGVIPFHARRNGETFVAGKLEALAVDSGHRGRRAEDGGSLATDILSCLYPFAVENGIEAVFGLAPPPVARIHTRAGCHQVPTNAPAYTCIADATTFGAKETSLKRRVGARGLGWMQRALVETAGLTGRTESQLERPRDEDAGLASSIGNRGGWTVSGADAWEWFASSSILHGLQLPGRGGSRALLRLDDSQAATVQIVSWRPQRAGLSSAFRLLAAVTKLARAHHAPTVRFQPWRGGAHEAILARACRLAGFVQRPEADLLLYPDGPSVDDVRLTPFFYVTF
jgi:hypothetical protein